MLNSQQEKPPVAIFQQAFRPLFLAGSLFSVIAILLWGGLLTGNITFAPYGNILFWHGHEMLFGFAIAILCGFLLTAVQSWTGLRAIHGKSLAALLLLWLAARILMLTGGEAHAWLIIAIDCGFLIAAGLIFACLVIKAKNYRNLQFVPIFLLLVCANLQTHLSVSLNRPELFTGGMYTAIMLVTLILVIIGGRIIPLFTAGGTGIPPIKPLPWLEGLTLAFMWLIVFVFVTNAQTMMPTELLALLFGVLALSNAFRAYRWQIRKTLANPLLWSLQLAYWFIPAGFFLFSLHYAGLDIRASTALHCLTAGAMGSLVLAMIARVSLGHTGRPMRASKSMSYAFIFILAAGAIRVLTDFFPGAYSMNVFLISILLWALAYGIYLLVYFRPLTEPRADGKPG